MTKKQYRQPMIIYLIRVKNLRTDKPVENVVTSTKTREVTIMPFTPVAPPLVSEAFPGEYISYATTEIKQHKWRRALGTLRLSAAEPPPLNILAKGPRLSTMVVLSVVFDQSKALKSNLQGYPLVITTQFRTRTFYSTRKIEKVPTVIAAKTSAYLRVREKKGKAEIREYDKVTWRRETDLKSSEQSVSRGTWFSANIMVPINVAKPLLPNFVNPLAARRYTIMIRLAIKGLSHKPAELILPIQVINWPSQGSGLETFDGILSEGSFNGISTSVSLPQSLLIHIY